MTLILRPSLLALGLTLALTACGRAAPLTEQEQRTVTELTSHMKTHCVGRYLIDLPADVQTSGSATLQGVQVSTAKMTQQEFLKEMEKREKELRAVKHPMGYQFFYSDPGYYVTKSQAESIAKEGIRYFIHLRSEADPGDTSRTIEVYKWDKGYRLQLQIDGSDFRNSIFKDRPSVQKMKKKNDVDYKFFHTLELARSFRGRADDDIPNGPGVCFEGGFIAGAASDKERVATIFRLKDHPDVKTLIITDSGHDEDTTLLQRSDQIDAQREERKGRIIRKGRVDLPGLSQPEELLMSGITNSQIEGHHFALEANSRTSNAKTPLFMLDMDNGLFPYNTPPAERTKASLTEGEAVALWDAVSRTIRVRPGAMDTMPLTPLPTPIPQVWSGQRCPQDGIWVAYCNQKDHTQYIAEGERMPTVSEKQLQPYRWLPERINAALAQRQRLPVTWVERKVKWLWIRPE